jgi:hypothetical protein
VGYFYTKASQYLLKTRAQFHFSDLKLVIELLTRHGNFPERPEYIQKIFLETGYIVMMGGDLPSSILEKMEAEFRSPCAFKKEENSKKIAGLNELLECFLEFVKSPPEWAWEDLEKNREEVAIDLILESIALFAIITGYNYCKEKISLPSKIEDKMLGFLNQGEIFFSEFKKITDQLRPYKAAVRNFIFDYQYVPNSVFKDALYNIVQRK